MTYDVKCYELARGFLLDQKHPIRSEEAADRLAKAIQQTIEDFYNDPELD